MRLAVIIGIVLAASTVVFSVSCSRDKDDGGVQTAVDAPKTQEAVDNPIQDLKQRWKNLVEKQATISAGMTTQQVREILGFPDLIHSLSEQGLFQSRRIGTSWLYLKDPKSSDRYRTCGKIIVHFNMDDNVIRVDKVGREFIKL